MRNVIALKAILKVLNIVQVPFAEAPEPRRLAPVLRLTPHGRRANSCSQEPEHPPLFTRGVPRSERETPLFQKGRSLIPEREVPYSEGRPLIQAEP